MNKNSNTYIIIYATVMVVIVALVLAFAAIALQPRQKANADNETKTAILQSIGLELDLKSVTDKTAYIDEQYDKHIKQSFVVDHNGNVVEGADAFKALDNLKAEYDKSEAERQLPVFVSVDDSGAPLYVLPLSGTGLWGPLWGYIALGADLQTVQGAVFDHKSETPGLGAEIATPAFEDQFKGKSIYDGGRLVGISVTKGSGSSAGNPNTVDAISGGTITSRGVENMLKGNLAGYAGFFEKQKARDADVQSAANPAVPEEAEVDKQSSPDPLGTQASPVSTGTQTVPDNNLKTGNDE